MFHKQWLKVLSCVLLLTCCFSSQISQADELSPQTDPFPPLVPIFRSPDKLKPLARIGDGWINDVALSPDNKTLAVATTIGVYLYDVEAFDKEPIRLDDDNSYIRDIAYSPDGRYLAVSGDTLQLWDTASLSLTDQIDEKADADTLLFSPDSSQLAFFTSISSTMKLWKYQSDEIQALGLGGYAQALSFSLDGSLIAATMHCGECTEVKVWEIASGRQLNDFVWSYSDTWLPDPHTEGWIGIDSGIERWDRTLENIILTVPTEQPDFIRSRIRAAHLSLDHQHALYLNGEGLLVKVDTESLEIIASTSLAWNGWIAEFSQDASLLVTATSSHIQIWNVDEGDLFAERDHFAIPIPVAFSPDRKFFATLSSDPYDVLIHDAVTNAVISRIRGHPGATRLVAFSPSGQLLATTGADNTVRIWDTAKGTPTQVVYNINRDIRFLQFPHESVLRFISGASTLEVYNLETGKFGGVSWDFEAERSLTQVQLEDEEYIRAISEFSFISASRSGYLYFGFEESTSWYKPVYKDLLNRPFNVIATTHAKDYHDKMTAASGENGVVLLFDRSEPDASTMMILTRHDSWIYALEFSPDDHVLASAGCAETVADAQIYGEPAYIFSCRGADLRLWYALSPQLIPFAEEHKEFQQYQQMTIPVDHTMPIYKVIFNSEGTILTTFSADGTMMHWGVLEEDVPEYLRD